MTVEYTPEKVAELVAEADKALAENQWTSGWGIEWLAERLSDALESVQDELRQERERADKLDSDHTDSEKALIDSVNVLNDDLARAREVIEKVKSQIPGPYMYATAANHGAIFIIANVLATYDTKGQP